MLVLPSKWKGSKSSVSAIAIDQNSQYLLTASKTITLWNLENRSILKVFHKIQLTLFKLLFFIFRHSQATQTMYLN